MKVIIILAILMGILISGCTIPLLSKLAIIEPATVKYNVFTPFAITVTDIFGFDCETGDPGIQRVKIGIPNYWTHAIITSPEGWDCSWYKDECYCFTTFDFICKQNSKTFTVTAKANSRPIEETIGSHTWIVRAISVFDKEYTINLTTIVI